jgi:hypothetical protein
MKWLEFFHTLVITFIAGLSLTTAKLGAFYAKGEWLTAV